MSPAWRVEIGASSCSGQRAEGALDAPVGLPGTINFFPSPFDTQGAAQGPGPLVSDAEFGFNLCFIFAASVVVAVRVTVCGAGDGIRALHGPGACPAPSHPLTPAPVHLYFTQQACPCGGEGASAPLQRQETGVESGFWTGRRSQESQVALLESDLMGVSAYPPTTAGMLCHCLVMRARLGLLV